MIDEVEQGITAEVTEFYVWKKLLRKEEIKAVVDGFVNFPSNEVLIDWLDFRKVPSESVELNPVSPDNMCMFHC